MGMIAGQLSLIVLSLLVLGAHSLRAGNLVLVAAVLLVMSLLAVRRPWVARLAQAALALGALEWIRTLLALVSARSRAGEPVTRLAIILGTVAAVTIAAALVFQGRTLRRLYGLEESGASGKTT